MNSAPLRSTVIYDKYSLTSALNFFRLIEVECVRVWELGLVNDE